MKNGVLGSALLSLMAGLLLCGCLPSLNPLNSITLQVKGLEGAWGGENGQYDVSLDADGKSYIVSGKKTKDGEKHYRLIASEIGGQLYASVFMDADAYPNEIKRVMAGNVIPVVWILKMRLEDGKLQLFPLKDSLKEKPKAIKFMNDEDIYGADVEELRQWISRHPDVFDEDNSHFTFSRPKS